MKYFWTNLLIFGGGFVAALNLAVMYPNDKYNASWLTVVLAVSIAIVAAITDRNKR